MKKEEFRAWLLSRGLTSNTVATGVYSVNAVERRLAQLGSSYPTIDDAYDADRLDGLRQAISALQADARAGGRRFEILMPQATQPSGRLPGYRSWLGQYRRFREEEAGQIRRSDWSALEALRDDFLDKVPDFVNFNQRDGDYFEIERAYKDSILLQISAVLDNDNSDEIVGKQVYTALMPNKGPLLRWQTRDAIEKQTPQLAVPFYTEIGRLTRSQAPVLDAVAQAAERLEGLRAEGASKLTLGEILGIVLTVTGFVRPKELAPFKISKAQALAKRLTGDPIFVGATYDRRQVEAWLALLGKIRKVMEEKWEWAPRDLLDVQGFAWVALDETWLAPLDGTVADGRPAETDTVAASHRLRGAEPTNLILYGPPGTGKTFQTATEAVRLCGGTLPATREETMARYRKLEEAGQIRFVTFHQSYSYEDFVEGLRPVSGSSDDGPGFRLEPRRGIFREIAALAEQARQKGPHTTSFDLSGRRVYKMSLGRAGSEDHIYDAAIAGSYAVLGWGGKEDWSDPKYENYKAVYDRWNQIEPGTSGNSGNIAQVWCFRTMQEGDLVVVSEGNSRFRAIGEVVGPYRYEPTDARDYSHVRPVQWRLVLKESLPVEEIYGKQFSQASCYQLANEHLKREALARLLPGEIAGAPAAAPDQFVLVVDEINRANISKVFGELITLIEPDKRLGRSGEITVRLPASGDSFGVPDNLHIVGTMNTADRSIALLDTALRRRFTFLELMPQPGLLAAASERCGIDLVTWLTTLNARIEYLFDREHQIGHAYFMPCASRADVDDAMRHRVIPLLAEYFYEDWAKVAIVLGDSEGEGRFLERSALQVPSGLTGDAAEERWRWAVKSAFADAAYPVLP